MISFVTFSLLFEYSFVSHDAGFARSQDEHREKVVEYTQYKILSTQDGRMQNSNDENR